MAFGGVKSSRCGNLGMRSCSVEAYDRKYWESNDKVLRFLVSRYFAYLSVANISYQADLKIAAGRSPSQVYIQFLTSKPTPPKDNLQAYPGGRELASTTSPASFSISSLAPWRGDRGMAIRPVRADSMTPNGEMSFMKESILEGFADLRKVKQLAPSLLRGHSGLRLTLPQCNYPC